MATGSRQRLKWVLLAFAGFWPGLGQADTLEALATPAPIFADVPGLAVSVEDVAVTLDTVTMHYEVSAPGPTPAPMAVRLRLPALDLADPDRAYALPSSDVSNFLALQVVADGTAVPLRFKQTAEVGGKDVGKRLAQAMLPLVPGSSLKDKLAAIAPETLLRLVADGVLRANGTSEEGAANLAPAWVVHTVASGQVRLAGDKPVSVVVTSRTSLGASQDTVLRKALRQGAGLDATADQVRRDYCVDDAFLGGIDKLAGSAADNAAGLGERRIVVTLAPGAGASAPVAHYRIAIDKGAPSNLVSTCLPGLTKTNATAFVAEGQGSPPMPVLRVLIIGRF